MPFKEGDRLLEVAGKPLETMGDLARGLASLHPGEDLKVRVVSRSGVEEELAWTPFPAAGSDPALEKRLEETYGTLRDGQVVNFYQQFRFTLEGYPLEFSDANFIGRTKHERPLEVELPLGSYLFVFRKDGNDTRYPLAVPGARPTTVRILAPEQVPEGYIYVPEGDVATGGDRSAWGALPAGLERVPGFFIAKHEVTAREWEAFLNDPELLARTDDSGSMEPLSDEVKTILARVSAERVQIVPTNNLKKVPPTGGTRSEKGWKLLFGPEVPIHPVSHVAALEYAHWLTRKAMKEGRAWRYRLPTDEEWERAARGADRRRFVWGNYFLWSCMWAPVGSRLQGHRTAAPWGIIPEDESVFGAKDMAGSITEHTLGRPVERSLLTAYRGGGWDRMDEEYFHIASRSSLLPTKWYRDFGFRLVVDLEPERGRPGR